MKIQCSFTLFGNTWTCTRENRPEEGGFGGECDIGNKKIFINKDYDPETFLDYLHHELMEGSLFLNACAYQRFFPDKKELFMLEHAQMDVVSGAVRGAYEEIKQNMGINQDLKNTKAHKEAEISTKRKNKTIQKNKKPTKKT
jgi:hypothetical protein